MNTIQAISAAYILFIFVVGFGTVIHTAVTGRRATSVKLNGWPALVLAVAILVCAVTTLAHV